MGIRDSFWRNKARVVSVVVTVILFTVGASAQKSWQYGTLYLKGNVQKEGLIKVPINPNSFFGSSNKSKVKFKSENSNVVKVYQEKDLDSLKLNNYGSYFFIPVSKKKNVLLRLVVNEKNRLYGRTIQLNEDKGNVANPTYISRSYPVEYYFMRSGETRAMPLVKYNNFGVVFKKYALKYFDDCPSLTIKIKDKTYGKDDVVKIVNEYNNCKK